ncbi:malto-oligosyltrehalose synthase [Antarcticibacterium arcticum]|uniref:Malto-oligosyltrehalose synthase n=1 Tax=Antarcticibacterium arcticum TaxID=2585771 RepID=A0A5B8YLE6_9FLAO|nr:malto-oligosyltrehalose synthase [Antarcticibacterium arcticum]QED37086.1 malto-oligosyltrehalose synthase [Antarcticibacterium arcticum]
MIQPDTTYRLQLSPQFTFKDLDRILDYLDDLGISTIYSAPFFKASKGSMHGYDILDPFTINPEIGTLEEFKAIGDRMKKKEMTWIQDIVPNHMAFHPNNPWIKDIFELGPQSRFYNYFDIDWGFKDLNKVFTPFLGSSLEEALDQEELKLVFNEKGIFIEYFDAQYPVNIDTYITLLREGGESYWLNRFISFSENCEQWNEIKQSFLENVFKNDELEKRLGAEINSINNSKKSLKEILRLQYFVLIHWQKTETEINYRRFFTINGLICLRMEEAEVFNNYHTFIKELCDEGYIHGLRIDHIDGLFDPESYLQRLRETLGENFYIIVEKILEFEEKLPRQWPVHGTSGYEFLAQANHLFTQTKGQEEFTFEYEKISPKIPNYESLIYQKKLFILKERMGGELHNLWLLLKSNELLPEVFPEENLWKDALAAFLGAFPVYRVYPRKFPLKPKQIQIIAAAYLKATAEFPGLEKELKYLNELYMGEAQKDKSKMLHFLQRCQQFSGPLAAKGVEDTSFYIYNRLIAHNEVGDSPGNFGLSVKGFHQKMLQRSKENSLSLNATATHDTKRGEDARMRLDVLSEIPGEWFKIVGEWRAIAQTFRKDQNIPDKNEEYFIYQSLLGNLPFKENDDEFLERTGAYLQKVLREAKIHSNWATPDEVYENKVFEFIKDLLENENFRKSFDPFWSKVAGFGAIKSIGQCLIKITAPGIPDIYQGTELWDFSYVDPDNRRAVDYALRTNYVADFRTFSKSNLSKKIHSLKLNYINGKIKMYVLSKSLITRRREKDIYQKGEYVPLTLKGKGSKNFISYARVLGEEWRLIVVPVFVTGIFDPETLKPRNGYLSDVFISLPENAPLEWDYIFSGKSSITEEGLIPVQDFISEFPVALLKNRKQTWT